MSERYMRNKGSNVTACPCGRHASLEDHKKEFGESLPNEAFEGEGNKIARAVESVMFRAIIPHDETRRNFLRAVGAGTALAALSQFFPLATAQEIANDGGPLEKKKVNLGFVPITCTTPMLLADAKGYYQEEGLDVTLTRTPGWSVARDNLVNGNYDASHMVLAMPMTMTMGVGSPKVTTYTSLIQNINGDALTLHMKHKDRRDPKDWKGFKFGIPHDHSVHAMLLRYYLASHGLDPDRDVELRVFPPPDSVANMAAGNLDGMFFAEPWNQRAVFEGVGFLHLLSRDIFLDHPCCVFSVTNDWMRQHPNTYGALFRAVARAGAFADEYENRQEVAELLAPREYLNQPLTVLQQVLLGRYADGLGNIVEQKDRIGFQTFPYESTALWLMTQLKRWGIVPADTDMRQIAAEVFLATDAQKRLREMGLPAPDEVMVKHQVLGRTFDPAKAEEYLEGFEIRRRAQG